MNEINVMQMMKSIALIGGFSILGIVIITIWVLLMIKLLKSSVSAKERENSNVEPNAGDWLLAIIKFSGVVLCPIALYWVLQFILAGFALCAWLLDFKSMKDILNAFIPAMFLLFFVSLGLFSVIAIIRIMAKESAVKRGINDYNQSLL